MKRKFEFGDKVVEKQWADWVKRDAFHIFIGYMGNRKSLVRDKEDMAIETFTKDLEFWWRF